MKDITPLKSLERKRRSITSHEIAGNDHQTQEGYWKFEMNNKPKQFQVGGNDGIKTQMITLKKVKLALKEIKNNRSIRLSSWLNFDNRNVRNYIFDI